jgi:chromosome segregation ATPase
MEIIVHHYFHEVSNMGQNGKYDHILQHLHDLGVKMSALSDAVDLALASEADEDAQHAAVVAAKDQVISDLQAQLEQSSAELQAAMANDAADAQTIANKQAELDAQAADTQAQIDRLNEAFPTTPPVEEPPVEEVPPVEEPQANPGNGGV